MFDIKMFFWVLICFSIASCNGDDRQYIERTLSTSFNIPAGLNTIESHFFIINDIETFREETLQSSGLPVGVNYEINGSKCLLTNRLGGVDFSVIDRISVFAVDQEDNTKRIEMFYNENINFQTSNEIKLLASVGNIAPYIKDNKLNLEVRIKFRGFLLAPITADMDFSYIIYKN